MPKQETIDQVQAKIDEYKKSQSPNTYRYPLSERNVKLDASNFLVFEYGEKSTDGQSWQGSGQTASIFIPPQSLNYTRSYDYADEGESVFGSAAAAAADAVKGTKSLIDSLKSATSGTALRASAAALNQFDTVRQAAGNLGYAYNPNIEFYFKQPNFRVFEFNFPFLPKSEEESEQVLKIVKFFEKWSAPVIESKFLFKYPKTWKIGGANPKLNFSTKECVMDKFTVSHGSQQGYTTFKNGMPTMTELSISFKEIELYSQEEIEG